MRLKLFALLMALLLFITSCTSSRHVDVHEWGVLYGCHNSFTSTNRPVMVYLVKQPVLYLYNVSRGSITVHLNKGNFLMVYPGNTSSRSMTWFYTTNYTPKSRLMINHDDFEPLSSVIPVLSRASDSFFYVNNNPHNFLYYEFNVSLAPGIAIINKTDSYIVIDSNISTKNFYFISHTFSHSSYLMPIFLNTTYRVGFLSTVTKGIHKVMLVDMSPEQLYKNISFTIQQDFLNEGLTHREFDAFDELWLKKFMYGEYFFPLIIYKYPNKLYESLVSINGNPSPVIHRSIYLFMTS